MKDLRKQRRPVRLEPESYTELRTQILRRDGWKCQACGSLRQLQVHHKQFRSRSGEDQDDNLITLCASCHERIHEGVGSTIRQASL